MNRFQKLFAFSFLSMCICWITIIPLWHTPDEQAHFGQVAFVAEMGRKSNPDDKFDLTEEIYISEQLLGTLRDNLGNNKFTFHPDYKIEYTDSLIGKYEASISALARGESKSKFVIQEASRYPLLYYYPATLLYKLFYYNDLFTRVFIVRFWSLLIFIGIIFTVYKIGKIIFGDIGDNSCNAIVYSMLVAFQPMMVFANVGVNSDVMGNFLFTLFIYFCLRLIIKDFEIKDVIFIIIVTVLSFQTKPQFVVMLPILAMVFIFVLIRDFKRVNKIQLIFSFLLSVFFLLLYLFKIRFMPLGVVFLLIEKFNFNSFVKFTWEYTLPHTYREVMPWYWGVYDWLGVTYPRFIHRVINRITLVAVLGYIFYMINIFRRGLLKNRYTQGIFFLLIINFIYFFSISVYDWFLWYTTKYQLGVQGRYFFPIISIHMLILFQGWTAIFPKKWKLKIIGTIVLPILMIFLNLYALYVLAFTYYHVSSINTFVTQASQYKPIFLKGFNILFWFILYLISAFFSFKELYFYMRQNSSLE